MEVTKMGISNKARHQKRKNYKNMSTDVKKVAQGLAKPPYSYAELIAQAIISVSNYKLPLNKIYEWISLNYPFYRLSETGWQNSIRHNLSLNNSFVKCPRTEEDPGKGCYWTIVKDQRSKFEALLSKKIGSKGTYYTTTNTITSTSSSTEHTITPSPSRRHSTSSTASSKKKYQTQIFTDDSSSELSTDSDYNSSSDTDDYYTTSRHTNSTNLKHRKNRKSTKKMDDLYYPNKSMAAAASQRKKSSTGHRISKKSTQGRKMTTTLKANQVPASPTPSPILNQRQHDFKFENDAIMDDESSASESEVDSMDDFEDYPPSPQSPELAMPLNRHTKYDFTFDLFPENPCEDEEIADLHPTTTSKDSDSELEEDDEVKVNSSEVEEVTEFTEDESSSSEESELEDESESESESELEDDDEEEEEEEEFDEFEEKSLVLPTIKISKSVMGYVPQEKSDDLPTPVATPLTENDMMMEEIEEEEEEDPCMNGGLPSPLSLPDLSSRISSAASVSDEDDDIMNTLKEYNQSSKNEETTSFNNEDLDVQYNYYLHSPIFNSLTCPELADMCFGVNLNTLDYSSLTEDFRNIPDKLDFVEMGVENWWRDESNNFPIYG